MCERGVRQLALSDNVLAAHVHSGTSQPLSFCLTHFIFHPILWMLAMLVLLFLFQCWIGNVAVRLMLRIV